MINSGKCCWDEQGGKRDLILIVDITSLFRFLEECEIVIFKVEKLI